MRTISTIIGGIAIGYLVGFRIGYDQAITNMSGPPAGSLADRAWGQSST